MACLAISFSVIDFFFLAFRGAVASSREAKFFTPRRCVLDKKVSRNAATTPRHTYRSSSPLTTRLKPCFRKNAASMACLAISFSVIDSFF